MMKVEWSAASVADVDRFAHFLEDRFPEMATAVGRELLQQSDLLIEHPQLGARWPLALTFANSSCAFSTHFTVTPDRLVILRVFHGREARDK